MKVCDLVVLSAVLLLAAPLSAEQHEKEPRALVARVVQEAGGANALHDRKDVEYTYLYRRGDTGTVDLSLERYVFDGEKSWARYLVHEMVAAGVDGPVVQGYDGTTSWESVGGKPQTDRQSLARANFLRKTNFYWFAMTFKLLDPGLHYAYEGRRKVGDTFYELVKVGFDQGVGDVSDTYVLYINPKTWRVDQFLFTVLDFGMKDPFLMDVDYELVDGVLLRVKR
ncbi:MAG: hypothetical protein HKN97_04940, partial [Myxococcales bacterium]|nr:hypothetical protein [Myxococcales bacterium]